MGATNKAQAPPNEKLRRGAPEIKCERGPPSEFSLLLGLVPGTTFRLVITIEEGTRNVCGKPKPNGAASASRRNFDAKPKKSPRQFSYSRWRALRGR